MQERKYHVGFVRVRCDEHRDDVPSRHGADQRDKLVAHDTAREVAVAPVGSEADGIPVGAVPEADLKVLVVEGRVLLHLALREGAVRDERNASFRVHQHRAALLVCYRRAARVALDLLGELPEGLHLEVLDDAWVECFDVERLMGSPVEGLAVRALLAVGGVVVGPVHEGVGACELLGRLPHFGPTTTESHVDDGCCNQPSLGMRPAAAGSAGKPQQHPTDVLEPENGCDDRYLRVTGRVVGFGGRGCPILSNPPVRL